MRTSSTEGSLRLSKEQKQRKNCLLFISLYAVWSSCDQHLCRQRHGTHPFVHLPGFATICATPAGTTDVVTATLQPMSKSTCTTPGQLRSEPGPLCIPALERTRYLHVCSGTPCTVPVVNRT